MSETNRARRNVLVGALGYSMLPRSIFAQDPATIAAVIGAVVKMIQAASDAQAESEWKSQISQKLAEIESKVDNVLVELKDLRVYIHEEEQATDLRHFRAAIYGDKITLDGILGGKIGAKEKDRISDIAKNLQRNINQFPQLEYSDDGKVYLAYAGYAAIAYGLSALLVTFKILGVQKATVKREVDYLLANFFLPSIDDNKYRSFAWAFNTSKATAATILASISQTSGCVGYHANCRTIGRRNDFVGVNGGPEEPAKFSFGPKLASIEVCDFQNRFLDLRGDVHSGFSRGDLREKWSNKDIDCKPFPGHTFATNDGNQDEAIAAVVLAEYNAKASSIREEEKRQSTLTNIRAEIEKIIGSLRTL